MWRIHVLSGLVLVLVLGGCSLGKSSPKTDDTKQADANFANICAKCHGQDGTGGVPVTPDGLKPRDLTDPAWQASVIDEQIEVAIRTGKPLMPAFQTVLTSEQIRGLVAKVRRLRKGDAK